jgi:hypothetical protein
MEARDRTNLRRALWGVLLIAVGVVFLFDQFGLVDVGRLGRWWPAAVMALGVVRLATPDSRKQIAEGVSFLLFGLWFFACTWHWLDLTYGNSWPIVLVIWGNEIVLVALLERLRIGPAGKEPRHA